MNHHFYFFSSKPEGFLKDHVTLKTAENSALITGINYILKLGLSND